MQGIHLGQRVDGVNRFLGTLDDVRVYRRGLTTLELDQIRLQNQSIGGELGLRLPLESVHQPLMPGQGRRIGSSASAAGARPGLTDRIQCISR